MLTFSGCMQARLEFVMCPVQLRTLSEGALVAGTQKYLAAKVNKSLAFLLSNLWALIQQFSHIFMFFVLWLYRFSQTAYSLHSLQFCFASIPVQLYCLHMCPGDRIHKHNWVIYSGVRWHIWQWCYMLVCCPFVYE